MAAPTIYNTREPGSKESILRGDSGPGLREASSRSAEAYAISGRESRESVRSLASASSAGAVGSERKLLSSTGRTQSDTGGRKRSDLNPSGVDAVGRVRSREGGRPTVEARPSTRTGEVRPSTRTGEARPSTRTGETRPSARSGRPSLGGVGLVLNSRRRQRPEDSEGK